MGDMGLNHLVQMMQNFTSILNFSQPQDSALELDTGNTCPGYVKNISFAVVRLW